MIVVRWGAFLLMVVCLAVCWGRQLYDGVWLIGLLAGLVFLGTLGLFSPRLWVGDGSDSEPSRLDRLDRPYGAREGCRVDESLAGRVTVPAARHVLWVLGDALGHMPARSFWLVRLIQLIRAVVGNEAVAAQSVLRALRDELPEYVAAVEAVTVGAAGEVDPEPLRRLVKNATADA